jgi:hypothetical protein
VFHRHQPRIVSRHHGKEQMLLVGPDDLVAMLGEHHLGVRTSPAPSGPRGDRRRTSDRRRIVPGIVPVLGLPTMSGSRPIRSDSAPLPISPTAQTTG